MRTRGLIVFLLAGVVVPSGAISQELPSAVEWIPDADFGFELARQRRQAVLIDFYADWCAPCREMDKTVWTDEDVAMAARRVVLVRVDFDEARGLVSRYRVEAVPTMVFVDPWGVEVGRIVGSLTSSEMIGRFEVLPGSFAAVSAYQERAQANPRDVEALVRIGAFYRAQGLLIGADVYFESAIEASDKGKRDPVSAAEAYLGLGLDHLDRHQYKESAKYFEQCVEKFEPSPHRPQALFGLVLARARLGDQKKARSELERLTREYPDFPSLEAARRAVLDAAPESL